MLKLPLHFYYLTLCTLLIHTVNSQTVWQDAFADSNFTQNPIWVGDTADFEISIAKKLRLNAASVTAIKKIKTPSTAIWDATWEFTVFMDFNPSSNNYCRVHFAATTANLDAGYFLQLGGNSDDKIILYRQQGNKKTKLLESTKDWLDQSKIEIKIKIERNTFGQFQVWADTSGSYKTIGTTSDSSILVSQFFAWECVYTATRANKFYLDDISVNGKIFIDNTPPKIIAASFANTKSLQVVFSEAIDSNSAKKTTSYLLSQNYGAPDAVTFLPPNGVELFYAQGFANATLYDIKIEKIEDLFGNELIDTTFNLTYFIPAWADVLFSEIMFDPTPPVNLPEVEYLEIYNRSNFDINLKDWQILLGNKKIELPNYTLKAKAYLLIADSISLPKFTAQNKMAVTWPGSYLTNSGGTIYLENKNGDLIHYLEYSPDLYGNSNKANGGWSLENTNINLPCFEPKFWTGSNNLSGGTPGEMNSQSTNETDIVLPYAKYLVYKNPVHLQIYFSERVENLQLYCTLPIDSIFGVNAMLTQYSVLFSSPMEADKLYELILQSGTDCNNNLAVADTLVFGIPQAPDSAQVLLNEILFNPSAENTDFLEIYNNGNTCLALNNLRLAQINLIDKMPDNVEMITADSVILPPHQLWVFSEDVEKTAAYHNIAQSRKLFETNLPSMPQRSGTIGICTASLNWLDRLEYSEKWHHELINDPTNVSLERVFLHTSTQEATNWQSASYFKDYATPTAQNSQVGNYAPSGSVTLSTDLITPNNDGFEDWVSFQFELEKPGWVANIIIFDGIGRPRKHLVNNKVLGIDDSLIWNATNDKDELVRRGMYIVFIELWHPDGEKLVFKKTVAVHYP